MTEPESTLQEAFAQKAYTVGPPWGDSSWIVLGNPDPHVAMPLVDCNALDCDEDRDLPFDAEDVAAEIVKRWNMYEEARRVAEMYGAGVELWEAVMRPERWSEWRAMFNDE